MEPAQGLPGAHARELKPVSVRSALLLAGLSRIGPFALGLALSLAVFVAWASGQETGGPGAPPADTSAAQPGPADTGAAEARDAGPSNPFAGFETHFLSNGVKVWFKQLPGAPNVSVSAGVPVGSDADPPGKEQLAHFTEHMLFSDHDGRTEQQIKDAVEGIGGRRNGFTYRDRTWYYVTIGREHGLFAIEWLAGILSPHEMDPAVVDRGRQPVQNEIRARPREFFDHLVAALNPGWLAFPDFWEREFGMERSRAPFPDMWRSLQGITPEDLGGFYDRYYSPAVMTVTIVGDLDRDEALARAQRTFGSFPARPVERWATTAEDPGRGRSTYQWGFQSAVGYQSRHKLFYASSDELLTAMFVRDLLNRRLNQRLRYGERKAVYGASANLVMRGPAAYLQVSSRIDEDDFDFAVAVIDEEIGHLRSGSLGTAEFEADRAAVIERLRGANQTGGRPERLDPPGSLRPGHLRRLSRCPLVLRGPEPEPGRVLRGARLRRVSPGPVGVATAAGQPGDGRARGGDAHLDHPEGGRVGAGPAHPDEGHPLRRSFPAAGGAADGVHPRDGGVRAGSGTHRRGGDRLGGGPLASAR